MAIVASAYAKQAAYAPVSCFPGAALLLSQPEAEGDFIEAEPEVVDVQWSPWEVLGLLRDSTAEECVRSYKRLSLRWHPDRNVGNEEQAEKRFKAINDAYHILVDPGPPPTLRQHPQQNTQQPDYGYLRTEGMHKSVQKVGLPVTLEELFRGVVRRKRVERGRCRMGDMEYEKKIVEVKVRPGWHSGTMVVYRNEGDQSSGGQRADLVFELQQSPHVTYRRAGDDIEHTHVCAGDAPPLLRLPSLEGREVGTPTGPLVAYVNFFTELAGATVTLLQPKPLPPAVAATLPPGAARPLEVPGKDVWAKPAVKSLKLRDRDTTACRERLPGPNQCIKGAKVLTGRGGLLSISWRVSKRSDEVVVGLVPPEAQIDKRFGEEGSRKWGLLWGCDGSVYNLGSGMVRATAEPYGAGDVLQMSVQLDEREIFLLKNGKLVYRAGQKHVVDISECKPGDIHTIEGAGMPISRVLRDAKTGAPTGFDVVGRGDLLVYFKAPKTEAAQKQEALGEADAWPRLVEWLECRGHPVPQHKTTDSGGSFQVKLTLVQARPFRPEGSFNDIATMGKQAADEEAARASAAAKALRILEGLAKRFPDAHKSKRKRSDDGGHAAKHARTD